jgi:thiamine biosynthesis lipoprotein
MREALRSVEFRAMGTFCLLSVSPRGDDELSARRALTAGKAEVTACELALSRFDPASDLTRANAAAGSWVAVDERLVGALAQARRMRDETGGLFDPTVLPALIAAGYDRTFEQLSDRHPLRPVGWNRGGTIELDDAAGMVRVAPGTQVDLGGIGKGFAAERALDAMRVAWPAIPGAIVDLGGDVAVLGTPPEGGDWHVAVADPQTGSTVATLRLPHGGVATSGRNCRRFGPGRQLHHLIDPATGAPATSPDVTVTVVASSAPQAEAHATAVAVLGLGGAPAYLHARPHLGALIAADGEPPVAIGEIALVNEPRRLLLTLPTLAR